jgi:hypothetical protein
MRARNSRILHSVLSTNESDKPLRSLSPAAFRSLSFARGVVGRWAFEVQAVRLESARPDVVALHLGTPTSQSYAFTWWLC